MAVAEQRLGELSGSGSGDNVGALRSASGLVLGWYGHALAQIRPQIAEDWYSFADARPFWRHKKH